MTESVEAEPTEVGKRDDEGAAERIGTPGQISAEVDRIIGQRLDSLVAMRIERVVESIYAGPMPPPEILQGYEETIPGAAERLLAEFENQAHHRRKLEDRTNRASVEVQKRGQWMAYSLSLLVVLLGGGLILSGNDIAGLAAVIGALAAPISVLLLERKRGERELVEKRRRVEAGGQDGGREPTMNRHPSDSGPS